MPGHAVASGSVLGGFIEGVTGGFERTTEFRRRRRLEQQVAEQFRVQAARQGEQDVLAAEDRERAAADRAREHAIRAFELSQKHGLRFDPNAVQERVGQLRQDVGEAITPGAGSLPPGLTRVGPSAAEREAQKRSGVLDRVAEFMAMSPEEREAAMQDPAMRQALDELGKFDDVFDVATAPPAGSSVRFGVTGTGGRTLTGGTREQADRFASEFPPTPSTRTPSDLSVPQAFQILKDRYAKFVDDGSGKLVFDGYEKPLPTILAEARELARGGQMTPRAPEAPEVEEGPGPVKRFFQRLIPGGESGLLPQKTPDFSREETQRRAQELEAEGKPRDEIRRIMQSEGYNIQ